MTVDANRVSEERLAQIVDYVDLIGPNSEPCVPGDVARSMAKEIIALRRSPSLSGGEVVAWRWRETAEDKWMVTMVPPNPEGEGCVVEPLYASPVPDIIAAKDAEIAELRRERDEAMGSAHNWHGQCQSIATILDLHEPECLGFAGEVRTKFEAAEARANAAVDPAAFAEWLRPWVKRHFGKWITHNTAKGAHADFLSSLNGAKAMTIDQKALSAIVGSAK